MISEFRVWVDLPIIVAVCAVLALVLISAFLSRKPSIKFHPNDGNATEIKTYDRSALVNLPHLSGRTCHAFEGWYYDAVFLSRAPDTIELKKRGAIKLYARWVKKEGGEQSSAQEQEQID